MDEYKRGKGFGCIGILYTPLTLVQCHVLDKTQINNIGYWILDLKLAVFLKNVTNVGF